MNKKFSIYKLFLCLTLFIICAVILFISNPATANIVPIPIIKMFEPKLSISDHIVFILSVLFFMTPLCRIFFILFATSSKEKGADADSDSDADDKVSLSADAKTEICFIIANFIFFLLLFAAMEYLSRYYIASSDTRFKEGTLFYDRSIMFFAAAFMILILSVSLLWQKINLKILRPALITLLVFYFVVFLMFLYFTATLIPMIENNNIILKAFRDCERIAYNVRKFNSLEHFTVQDKYLSELVRYNYMPELKDMTDPWGRRYCQDYPRGVVYSSGENMIHCDGQIIGNKADPYDYANADDIFVDYIGPLMIVDAWLDVNPEGGDFKASTNPVEIAKCYDVLNLRFNKSVLLPSNIDLSLAVPPSAYPEKLESYDTQATTNQIFRYFMSEDTNAAVIAAPADLAVATGKGAKISLDDGKKQILIRFSPGFTCADPSKKLLIPATHYINLTGSTTNPNKLFVIYDRRIEAGERAVKNYDEKAIASNKNILIK